MKVSLCSFTLSAAALCSLAQQCTAFASPAKHGSAIVTKRYSGIAEELGLPCGEECALSSFPNMPESVHPGVLSGQAQMDLLNHAKENGTLLYFGVCNGRRVLDWGVSVGECVCRERFS